MSQTLDMLNAYSLGAIANGEKRQRQIITIPTFSMIYFPWIKVSHVYWIYFIQTPKLTTKYADLIIELPGKVIDSHITTI